jgi:hypothetical protein
MHCAMPVTSLARTSTFVIAFALCGLRASADEPALQQATFDRTAPRAGQQTVQFLRRSPRTGDEIEQNVSLEMRLTTSVRQGNELVEKDRLAIKSYQRRAVTTTEVAASRTTAVEVRYVEATKHIAASTAPNGSPIAQPVHGKTYRCRREAGDAGTLTITDAAGNTPPTEELEIVAENMATVGRPNPLMDFLAGRTVAVGETLTLPQEVAEQVFNLGERFGEVNRFDLRLEKLASQNGLRCASFQATVEAASNDSSQMRMQVAGPLIVEIATCRAVKLALNGPIAMSETRGSYSNVQQLIATGQLKMSIDSIYRDAAR